MVRLFSILPDLTREKKNRKIAAFVETQEERTTILSVCLGPAKFIISGALEPPSDIASTTDFDKWYREEHIPLLSRMPGFIRSRRYEVKTAYTIKQLQPSDDMQIVPKYYALHEFGGEALPWKQIEESVGTEWAKKVMGSVQKAEVGWYKVKRVYPESEWGSVGN